MVKTLWASRSPLIKASAGPTLSRSQDRGCTHALRFEGGGARRGGGYPFSRVPIEASVCLLYLLLVRFEGLSATGSPSLWVDP